MKRILVTILLPVAILGLTAAPALAQHMVHDHVWSSENVRWGQGNWTLDGKVICVTFPGGVKRNDATCAPELNAVTDQLSDSSMSSTYALAMRTGFP